MLKWLPVFLSVLGALGYSSRDTELVQSGVQIVSDITDSRHFGLEAVGALLTDTIRPKSSENEVDKTGIHKKAPYTYHGKIIKIHDGDTLHVIDGDGAKHKIRMAYIDAPEINQAYGTRSCDNLIAAADGKKVKVRVFEKDRYQREVAQVSVGTTDLNLMQLRDGAAWHYDSYAKTKPPIPITLPPKSRQNKNVKVCGAVKIRKLRGISEGRNAKRKKDAETQNWKKTGWGFGKKEI